MRKKQNRSRSQFFMPFSDIFLMSAFFPGTFLNISSLFFAAGPASPARLPVSPASLKAVPAADLTAENSQDEICIPVTNALNFVFTFLSQSQTPKLSCKLISVKKLNDDAMKKWQEKDREIIKKCIFDTIYRTNLFSRLGYDFDHALIDAAGQPRRSKPYPGRTLPDSIKKAFRKRRTSRRN